VIDVEAIDHVNLRIPEGRIEEFVDFYTDTLGFETEDLDAYRTGDRPIFTVRVAETAVVHVSPIPDEEFEPPARENFDHVAVRVPEDAETIEDALAEAGLETDTSESPVGATGVAPAVYVTDPFGYRLEFKEAPRLGGG